MNNFSDQLREARKAAGYTQETMSQAIGMARTNYVPYETGKILPELEVMQKMADALSLPVQQVRAWRAVEELDPETLRIANEIMGRHSKEELRAMYEQAQANRETKKK